SVEAVSHLAKRFSAEYVASSPGLTMTLKLMGSTVPAVCHAASITWLCSRIHCSTVEYEPCYGSVEQECTIAARLPLVISANCSPSIPVSNWALAMASDGTIPYTYSPVAAIRQVSLRARLLQPIVPG